MSTPVQKQFNILLLGDSCLDVYQYGTVDRMSPEAPVPVFVPAHEETRPGMASNVYENLKALGQKAMTGGKLKVGFGSFWSAVKDMGLVPAGTVGGQAIYKVGQGIELIGKPGAKTVSDLFLPLSGEIIEFNDALESAPESVNSDPYGAGWMIKVKVADLAEVDSLLSSDAYKELIGA
jgi:hypothetical protein